MSNELMQVRRTEIVMAVPDPDLGEFYEHVLREEGYGVISTDGNGDFLKALKERMLRNQTNLLALLDISKGRHPILGKKNGLELVNLGLVNDIQILERIYGVCVPTIVTTSYNLPRNVDPMRKLVDTVLTRPDGVPNLPLAVKLVEAMNFPPGFIRC